MNNDCHYYFNDLRVYNNSKLCNDTWDAINNLAGSLNWYDLYRKVYPEGPLVLKGANRVATAYVAGEAKEYKMGYTQAEYTPWLKHLVREDSPILGNAVTSYLNREDVRKALNIPNHIQAWTGCANIDYHYQDEASYWIYPILRHKYKLMFFSGDTDGAVPTYGSRRWIKDLQWSKLEKTRPWFTDSQVSGYVEKFDGLDFVTVHGVGHMAPQWARKQVTTMISNWVHNETF